MARTEHLPIYKSAYGLCLYIERIVGCFSVSNKYFIGIDLEDTARKVLKLVVRANSLRDKEKTLQQLGEEIDEIQILLSLCDDLSVFPDLKSLEQATSLVTEIAKQNDSWLKSQGLGHRQDRKAVRKVLAGSTVR